MKEEIENYAEKEKICCKEKENFKDKENMI